MIGATVLIVKPRAPHEIADAVVVDVRDHPIPLDGGGLLPSQLFALAWPDGGETWHRRHEFEPVLSRDLPAHPHPISPASPRPHTPARPAPTPQPKPGK